MQAECIKAFGNATVGEIVSGLPDGAAVDPAHWRVIEPDPPSVPPEAAAAAVASLGGLAERVLTKENM